MVKGIFQVYLEVKLVPNLVYASKLLLRKVNSPTESTGSSTDEPAPLKSKRVDCYKSLETLEVEELQALEHVYTLVCHIVHLNDEFVMQFCDAIVILNVYSLINQLLGLGNNL